MRSPLAGELIALAKTESEARQGRQLVVFSASGRGPIALSIFAWLVSKMCVTPLVVRVMDL